jgi:hypothetical protein
VLPLVELLVVFVFGRGVTVVFPVAVVGHSWLTYFLMREVWDWRRVRTASISSI